MTRHGIRGGHRLLAAINRSGMMDRNVVYRIDRKISIVIPMHLSFGYKFFDYHVLANYEKDVVGAIAAEARTLPPPITFLDCGADIGLFSALVAARTPSLGQIIAFEPNPTVREYLGRNLAGLPVPAQAHHVAVSDFNGFGILRQPNSSASVHARFLETAPDGDIAVRTIDSLHVDVPGGLIIKIDVEGGELNVIQGVSRPSVAPPRLRSCSRLTPMSFVALVLIPWNASVPFTGSATAAPTSANFPPSLSTSIVTTSTSIPPSRSSPSCAGRPERLQSYDWKKGRSY